MGGILNAKLTRHARWDGECLVWTGAKRGHMGYGWLNDRSRGGTWLAHRWVWTILRGPIPERMIVMHTCDNPPCVNPAHLRLGTVGENQNDMQAKGRGTLAKSEKRRLQRAAALARPCSKCGGSRFLSGKTSKRVRCPKFACNNPGKAGQ